MGERTQWLFRWPNHCKHCMGWGVISWTEFHDGRMYPGETISEPCDACLGNNKCPRCGNENSKWDENTEVFVCEHCEWTSEKPDGYVEEFAPPEECNVQA